MRAVAKGESPDVIIDGVGFVVDDPNELTTLIVMSGRYKGIEVTERSLSPEESKLLEAKLKPKKIRRSKSVSRKK